MMTLSMCENPVKTYSTSDQPEIDILKYLA